MKNAQIKIIMHIILLFLSIVMGCNSPNEITIESEEFYPMKIGNQWEYVCGNTSKIEKVCCDAGMEDAWFVKRNGKVKYSFENYFGTQKYVMKNYSFLATKNTLD